MVTWRALVPVSKAPIWFCPWNPRLQLKGCWMPVFQRKRSIVFLMTTLALLLGVIAANYAFVGRQEAEQASVQRSLEVQLRLGRVLSMLQDAETGQRGYLLTHRETYLEPYSAALPAIDSEIGALRRIMNGSGREAADARRACRRCACEGQRTGGDDRAGPRRPERGRAGARRDGPRQGRHGPHSRSGAEDRTPTNEALSPKRRRRRCAPRNACDC